MYMKGGGCIEKDNTEYMSGGGCFDPLSPEEKDKTEYMRGVCTYVLRINWQSLSTLLTISW